MRATRVMATERQELPPLFRRHVRRPRLTRLLDETSAKAIVLTAPAGYGKTTLAAEWLQGRPDVAWYRATAASADVAALAVGVARALYPEGDLDDRLTRLLRVSDAPERAAETAAEILAKRLVNRPRAWLVVDDYHFIARVASAEDFIGLLVTGSPVRLLITTRVRPSWADTRRRAYGELFEVGRDRLTMTRAEAAQVLGVASTGRRSVVDVTGGWPVAIGLAAMGQMPPEIGSFSSALFDFFAEEVLRHEAPDLQRFMLETSVLPSLETTAINDVLAFAKAEVFLQLLRDKGLLHEFGDGTHFHPLVRSFLRQRLRAHDPVREQELLRSTVTYLRRMQRWDAAYTAAHDAGWLDEAAAIVGEAHPFLLASGRVATLERWLSASAAASLQSPAARLARAHVLLRRGRLHEARTVADAVADDRATPRAVASDALFVAGESALLLSDAAMALGYHRRAADSATSTAQSRQAFWGAFVSALEQGSPEAHHYLDELRAVAADDVDATLRSAIGRAAIADSSGTFSGVWAQERATLESISDVADPMAATSALGWFAYVNSVRGDYEMALGLADRAISLVREASLDFALGYCLIHKATAHVGLREFHELRPLTVELEKLAHDHEDPQFQIDLANLRLREQLARGALDDLESDPFDAEGVPRRSYGEHLALRAIVAASRPQRDLARSNIARAREVSRAAESQHLVAFAELILAADENDEYASALEDLLVRARTHECLGCFVTAYRASPSLLKSSSKSAKSRLIATPAIVRARDVILANRHGFAIKDGPMSAPPQLSPRERQVYALMMDGHSNPQIAAALVISVSTAKVHVHRILRKLGYKSRIEAVVAGSDRRT